MHATLWCCLDITSKKVKNSYVDSKCRGAYSVYVTYTDASCSVARIPLSIVRAGQNLLPLQLVAFPAVHVTLCTGNDLIVGAGGGCYGTIRDTRKWWTIYS